MKKILLTPYTGFVIVTRSIPEHARLYRKMFGAEYEDVYRGGLTTNRPTDAIFLVYARDKVSLVHELAHVVLDLFVFIGAPPAEANGEPFAYLLGHLYREATKK